MSLVKDCDKLTTCAMQHCTAFGVADKRACNDFARETYLKCNLTQQNGFCPTKQPSPMESELLHNLAREELVNTNLTYPRVTVDQHVAAKAAAGAAAALAAAGTAAAKAAATTAAATTAAAGATA